MLVLGIGLLFVPAASVAGAGLALLGFFGLFFGWSFWGVIPSRRVRALRKAVERTGVRVYTEPSIDSRGVRFALTAGEEANTYASSMERLVAAGIRPEKYGIPLIRAYSLQFARGILKKMNYLILLNSSGESLYVSTMSNVNVGLARYRKVWFASLEASPLLSSLYGSIR